MVEELKVSLCAICAWRETCRLKYRFQRGPVLNCVEFTRDLTLKLEEETSGNDQHEERKG